MEIMSNHQFFSQAASVGPLSSSLQVLHGALLLASLLLLWEGLELLLIIGRVANQAAFLTLWRLAKVAQHRRQGVCRATHTLWRRLPSMEYIRRLNSSYVLH